MKNYYYVSSEESIVSQLEENGIYSYFDISDYKSVCRSAGFISGLLEEKGLLCRKRDDAVKAHLKDKKIPFVFFTLNNVKYNLISFDVVSFDSVVEAVNEYRNYGRVFQFITMISGKFTEEHINRLSGSIIQRKRCFNSLSFQPEEFHVLGKISWYGNEAYIKPIIIY